jgi:hypothetical protein
MLRFRFALMLLLAVPASALAQTGRPQIIPADRHDVSPPLRDLPPAPRIVGELEAEPARLIPSRRIAPSGPDAALQSSTLAPTLAAPSIGLNFDGIGNGVAGFSVRYAPPDTNGAVGPNHFVQTVNTDIAVYTKTGALAFGPVATSTLWSGFGGGCETNNDGDPIVVYDRIADRFVVSQFSVNTLPYLQCVAVSQTGDPTGSYYRYQFNYGNTAFPDYPKLGVWPDAYYITYNIFNNGQTFAGAKVCAFDRASMLSGAAATQQCFNTSTTYGGLLPGDFDGTILPPAGAPNPVVALGATSSTLAYWKFHVDWSTPANTTFSAPTALTVAAYGEACGGGTCIPQGGTTQKLDSLADRLMYRAAYRNFGDHEALVVNHSVTAGTSVGVRWYELRNISGSPTVFQQGTFAPDASYRWMGSMAMDHVGNIAVGYSRSSSSLKPAIAYTTRLASDATGTLGTEGTIFTGGGSQTTNLSRWGDYSSMSIDPNDDCTFWYTTEYIPSNGTFNWRTRVATFKIPSCATTPDFALSASPSTVTVAQNASGTSTITVNPQGGFSGSVALSITDPPAGATASFAPTSTTGLSTLTFNVADAAPGTYALTVTGVNGSLTHTIPVTLKVVKPDFSLAASPSTVSVNQGAAGTSTITITPSNGFAGSVALTVAPIPSGATASFAPNPATGSSVLTLSSGTAAAGNYALTVTGQSVVDATLTHTTPVAFNVNAQQSFSIGATPASATVTRRQSTTYNVSVARLGGFAGSVTFGISGLPSGVSAKFQPASTTGNSSTLTVSANNKPTTGTFTLTITATSSGMPAASTTVSLTVN